MPEPTQNDVIEFKWTVTQNRLPLEYEIRIPGSVPIYVQLAAETAGPYPGSIANDPSGFTIDLDGEDVLKGLKVTTDFSGFMKPKLIQGKIYVKSKFVKGKSNLVIQFSKYSHHASDTFAASISSPSNGISNQSIDCTSYASGNAIKVAIDW